MVNEARRYQINKENNPLSGKQIVFIEDFRRATPYIELAILAFQPKSIAWVSAYSPDILTQELAGLYKPAGIGMIIADQFFENHKGKERGITDEFVYRVKTANPHIFVVEQSFAPQQAVYRGTDVVIHKAEYAKIINMSMKVALAYRLEAFRCWTNAEFLKAQEFVASSDKYLFDPVKEFAKLRQSVMFTRLMEIWLAGKDIDAFFNSLDINAQAELLHTAWTFLGHISAQSEETKYGLVLQRLEDIVTQRGIKESGRPLTEEGRLSARHLGGKLKDLFLKNRFGCIETDEIIGRMWLLAALYPDDEILRQTMMDIFSDHMKVCQGFPECHSWFGNNRLGQE